MHLFPEQTIAKLYKQIDRLKASNRRLQKIVEMQNHCNKCGGLLLPDLPYCEPTCRTADQKSAVLKLLWLERAIDRELLRKESKHAKPKVRVRRLRPR